MGFTSRTALLPVLSRNMRGRLRAFPFIHCAYGRRNATETNKPVTATLRVVLLSEAQDQLARWKARAVILVM